MNGHRRIAITGIGMVTPVGLDAPTTWASLVAGKSGVDTIRGFDASGFSARIGAEVKNFDAAEKIQDKNCSSLLPGPRICTVAAEEALTDAGLRPQAPQRSAGAAALGPA